MYASEYTHNQHHLICDFVHCEGKNKRAEDRRWPLLTKPLWGNENSITQRHIKTRLTVSAHGGRANASNHSPPRLKSSWRRTQRKGHHVVYYCCSLGSVTQQDIHASCHRGHYSGIIMKNNHFRSPSCPANNIQLVFPDHEVGETDVTDGFSLQHVDISMETDMLDILE